MSIVTSKDGTRIAYDRLGEGPAVILVDGALAHRAFMGLAPLAEKLAGRFTAYTYDRRGRGESGNTLPFAVEREIEDIDALISEAGGTAHLFGISSGGALALEAAAGLGRRVGKLAIYEAPYNTEAAGRERWREYVRELNDRLAAGRGGDALATFILLTGASPDDVAGMRNLPMWPVMEAVAPTLAYDQRALGADSAVPVARAAGVTIPALIMNGGASYEFMGYAAKVLARALPQGEYRVLEGQTHDPDLDVLVPALVEFFNRDGAGPGA